MTADAGDVERMCAKYEALIVEFVNQHLAAPEFEAAFFRMFQSDEEQVNGPAFDVLDGLFFYVDEYVADPELRARAGGLDDDQLRDRAREAYRRLQSAPDRAVRPPHTFIDGDGAKPPPKKA